MRKLAFESEKLNCLNKVIVIVCVIGLSLSCNKEEIIVIAPESPGYELLFSEGDTPAYYTKLTVIDYFKRVALGIEYDSTIELTRKWSSDMKIFVGGSPNDELLQELHSIKNEINTLVTDDFSIEIVNDSLDSNYYIFIGSGKDYANLFPRQSLYINDNWGLFYIEWNSDFVITSGHMYVDVYKADLIAQKHILREELTQSLGFPNDIPLDTRSIFYDNWSTTNYYSELDIEIIRLLYHPEMGAGLNESSVDNVLKGILGIR